MPLINLVSAMAFAKYFMMKRGVFVNFRMRTHPLDADDRREIDHAYKRIAPPYCAALDLAEISNPKERRMGEQEKLKIKDGKMTK